MSISRSLVSLVALTLLACSGASSSDPGGSGQTGDEQDIVAGKGIYVVVGAGPTGGSAVKLVNRTTTKCSDGKSQGSCSIVKLDSSALGLESSDSDSLEKAFFAGHALVQGQLTTETTKDPGSFVLPILKITAAWTGAGAKDAADADSVYRVTRLIQNKLCAQQSTCDAFHEELVNQTKGASDILDIDLSQAGASKPELSGADNETLIGAEGLLVVGLNHSLVHATAGTGVSETTTLVATDFYLPVKASSPIDHPTCLTLTCAQGFHCEMKGINGDAIATCIQN
jgi:hypothetical protein